jgi:hypothetical protein
MGYPLRWHRTDLVYEISLETIQGRFLLRPSREVSDLILGVLSRAQVLYPAIRLHAFVFTRDVATLLLATHDETQISKFMAYVAGGISRRLGRLLDWSGRFWRSRYRAVPVLDEEAITTRLRHVLARGVDEGLVVSPKHWPGASCVPALLGNMCLEGTWVDRDREAGLRAAGLEPPPTAYVQPYRVVLSPLPAWAGLSRAELVARHHAMIESIELEHLMRTHGEVMDPVALQQQDPFFRPPGNSTRRRLGRLCHATSQALVDGFRTAYRQFCAAFRAAAGALGRRTGVVRAVVRDFPQGSSPRPDLRVPWPRTQPPGGERGDEVPLFMEEETLRHEVFELPVELVSSRGGEGPSLSRDAAIPRRAAPALRTRRERGLRAGPQRVPVEPTVQAVTFDERSAAATRVLTRSQPASQ